jgi:NADH-quinone oxidoreductase subunit K
LIRPVIPYVTAALLFGLGVYGVLRRRNAVLVLMAVELMLNGVNLVLVTADTTVRAAVPGPHSGGVFALFVIVLAAAEVGVGLAVILQLFRLRRSVAVDEVQLTEVRWEEVQLGDVQWGEAPGGDQPGRDGPSGDRPSGDRPRGDRA